MDKPIDTIVKVNISLALLEGLAAFWAFAQQGSETKTAVFLGYSAFRILVLCGVLSLLILLTSSLWYLVWGRQKPTHLDLFIKLFFQKEQFFWLLSLTVLVIYLLLFVSDQLLGVFASYRDQCDPLLWWAGAVGMQGLISLLVFHGRDARVGVVQRRVLQVALYVFGMFCILVAFIFVTGKGLVPDLVYWQEPGAPILLIQVILASTVAFLFYWFAHRFRAAESVQAHILLAVFIWSVACALWLTQATKPTYNSPSLLPPNFQPYPFGDSLRYDVVSHGFLIGKPIPSDFWVKPFYSLFLAVLHLIAGEDYNVLIQLQVVILALIPVVIYFLTVSIGSRHAGIIAALLFVLRERNAMALSNVIQVAHLKLLLADVFSLGLVALLLWLIIRWAERANYSTIWAIGGMTGLLILTRGHPILIAPIVAFVLLLNRALPFKLNIRYVIIFGMSVVVTLAPWIWRTYELTGKFAYQSPGSPYRAQLGTLYSFTPSLADASKFSLNPTPELIAEYDALNEQGVQFIKQNPGYVLKVVSDHYFHNLLHSYIYLPYSLRIEAVKEYVKNESFWDNWRGSFSQEGWALLFLHVCLISLGIGSAWVKRESFALVPLLIGMAYNASVSIGRLSGWRFILPADWITLVYLSIGIAQAFDLLRWLLTHSQIRTEAKTIEQPTLHSNRIRPLLTGLTFALISLFLSYGHNLFVSRVEPSTIARGLQTPQTIQRFIPGLLSDSDLQTFLSTEKAILLYGKVTYPAFYQKNTGLINLHWSFYQPQPYSRLVFYLTGEQSMGITLRLPTYPQTFPDGAEAIVVGCQTNDRSIDALFVLLVEADMVNSYLRDPLPTLSCPFSEPQ